MIPTETGRLARAIAHERERLLDEQIARTSLEAAKRAYRAHVLGCDECHTTHHCEGGAALDDATTAARHVLQVQVARPA